MLEDIKNEMLELQDERIKKKLLDENCDVPVIGVKIGDMKKIVKKHKLNKNNKIAIDLIETKVYDLMYLGYLILDPKTLDKSYFEKWLYYSDYYKIRIHSLAYGIAEHPQFEYFLDLLKDKEDDYSLSIYYGILSGRIIIDPSYNNNELMAIIANLSVRSKEQSYTYLDNTKFEMNSLIGFAGIQIVDKSQELIEIANEFYNQTVVNIQGRKFLNQSNFILNSIKTNNCGKKRKSARC